MLFKSESSIAQRALTDSPKTLAGLSYFVIADVTDLKSSLPELQATVPDYQIPFVPIVQEGEQIGRLRERHPQTKGKIKLSPNPLLMQKPGICLEDQTRIETRQERRRVWIG
ncbi:MAG: hypothetical protein HZB19_04960 [Chloroflexi bacterium]|nr:hypothetical protein [Chloroflexota bacterium]